MLHSILGHLLARACRGRGILTPRHTTPYYTTPRPTTPHHTKLPVHTSPHHTTPRRFTPLPLQINSHAAHHPCGSTVTPHTTPADQQSRHTTPADQQSRHTPPLQINSHTTHHPCRSTVTPHTTPADQQPRPQHLGPPGGGGQRLAALWRAVRRGGAWGGPGQHLEEPRAQHRGVRWVGGLWSCIRDQQLHHVCVCVRACAHVRACVRVRAYARALHHGTSFVCAVCVCDVADHMHMCDLMICVTL